MPLHVQTLVNAPLALVWKAYTTPDDILQWNAASDDWHTTDCTVDLRDGGAFSSRMAAKDGSMAFDFAGVYEQVVPQQLIRYRFGERHASVHFDQEAQGVQVRIAFDSDGTFSEQQQVAGWQAILDRFGRYVEALKG